MSIRLETEEPSPELKEIARKELRETPEVVEAAKEELRALLKGIESLYLLGLIRLLLNFLEVNTVTTDTNVNNTGLIFIYLT